MTWLILGLLPSIIIHNTSNYKRNFTAVLDKILKLADYRGYFGVTLVLQSIYILSLPIKKNCLRTKIFSILTSYLVILLIFIVNIPFCYRSPFPYPLPTEPLRNSPINFASHTFSVLPFLRCYEAELKREERERHPINQREKHTLYPVSSCSSNFYM